MFVVIFEEVLQSILRESSQRIGYLLGKRRDDCDLIQVITINPRKNACGYLSNSEIAALWTEPLEVVGLYVKLNTDIDLEKLKHIAETKFRNLTIPLILSVIESPTEPKFTIYYLQDNSLHEVKYSIINLKSEIFERIQGIINTDVLSKKKAAVIGVGTGAQELL